MFRKILFLAGSLLIVFLITWLQAQFSSDAECHGDLMCLMFGSPPLIARVVILAATIYIGLFALEALGRARSRGKALVKAFEQHHFLAAEAASLPIVTSDYVVAPNEEVTKISDAIEDLRQRASAKQKRNDLGHIVDGVLLDLCEMFHQSQSIGDADKALSQQKSELASMLAMPLGYPNFARVVMPMLGFLGTIVGIMVAMTSLQPALKSAAGDISKLQDAIGSLLLKIGVAFDTTLVGLVMTGFVIYSLMHVRRSLQESIDECVPIAKRLVRRFRQPNWGKRVDLVVADVGAKYFQTIVDLLGKH